MEPSDDRSDNNNDGDSEDELVIENMISGYKHKKFATPLRVPEDISRPRTSTGYECRNREQDLVKQFLLLTSGSRTPAPPAGFMQLNGRHHQVPQVDIPLPRVGNTNPFTGMPIDTAQRLKDLRNRINNPFARANMPTQNVIRTEDVPVLHQQPHHTPSVQQRIPPSPQRAGNPAYDFGMYN